MKRTFCACTFAVVLCGMLLPSGMPRSGAEAALVSGWEPAGDVKIFSGENASFYVNCTAPGCASLVFQWSVDEALVAGETGPHFTFLAGTNLSKTLRIFVFVTDGQISAQNNWNLTVEPPVVAMPAGPVAMAEGEARTFRVIGAAGQNVSWFLDGADLRMNGTELVFSPDFCSAGLHLVTVSVEGTLVRTWTVTVTPVNRPPVLPQGRLVQAYTGETVSVKVNASDPDGRPLRYRWDIDSDGTTEIDSNRSGNLSHRFLRAREYRATLTVTDDEGASASTVYIFEVREKSSHSGWWFPAALAGTAAAALAVAVAVQARRLSKLKAARVRAGFFSERKPPLPEITADHPRR